MTRARRRELGRMRREANRLLGDPAASHWARKALRLVDQLEADDPRPSLRLRLKLRLAGVDAG